MQVRELAVPDAFEFTPTAFPDHRGLFVAPFQESALRAATGRSLPLGQTNHSVSRRGVLRGVHFADVPPGQAKYVYCPSGAGLDVVIDLRVGSPTFGAHDVVRLDAADFRAVFVPEGVGHAFLALEDDTVLSYLCSTGYNPGGEHGIDPLDPELALPWPAELAPILSEKDASAPSLAKALATDLLANYDTCLECYKSRTM